MADSWTGSTRLLRNPISLFVGVLSVVFGVIQGLAAFNRVDVHDYPFVKSESRALRLAMSAWMLLIGVVLLVSAFW